MFHIIVPPFSYCLAEDLNVFYMPPDSFLSSMASFYVRWRQRGERGYGRRSAQNGVRQRFKKGRHLGSQLFLTLKLLRPHSSMRTWGHEWGCICPPIFTIPRLRWILLLLFLQWISLLTLLPGPVANCNHKLHKNSPVDENERVVFGCCYCSSALFIYPAHIQQLECT